MAKYDRWFREWRGFIASREVPPPCRVRGCERLSYAPRGYCWTHHDIATRELKAWKEANALRRWQQERGVVR